jgi:hypothetical protein
LLEAEPIGRTVGKGFFPLATPTGMAQSRPVDFRLGMNLVRRMVTKLPMAATHPRVDAASSTSWF